MYSRQLNKQVESLLGSTKFQFVPTPTFKDEVEVSFNLKYLREITQDDLSSQFNGSPYLKSLLRMEQERQSAYTLGRATADINCYMTMLRHFDNSMTELKRIAPFIMEPEWSVASTTCALGITQPTHSFLEEFGAYSLTKPAQDRYPDFLLGYFEGHIQKMNYKKKEYRDIKASYPRGKNSGVPVIVSGGDRLLNDAVMFHNMLLGSLIGELMTDEKMSSDQFAVALNNMINIAEKAYGEMVFIGFDRYQHNGKFVPMRVGGHLMSSKNFQMRRRLINATVKMLAMANKPIVKAATEFDLATPMFSQDRPAITDRVRRCLRSGGVVVAFDQSRFDLRHGLDKLDMGNEIFCSHAAQLLNISKEKVAHLNEWESSLPALLVHDNRLFLGDGKAALKSGESGTSRKGCYMNAQDDARVTQVSLDLSDEALVNYYLRYEPSCILGDDLIKFFPNPESAERYERVCGAVATKLGVSLEIEKPTKFLGSFVDESDIARPWKTSIVSALQKVYFPERFKRAAAIPLSLKAKMDPFFENYPQANREQVYRLFRTAYSHVAKDHIYMSMNHKTIINDLPNSYSQFDVLTRRMLTHPEEFGLDNDFQTIDEILNIFGNGLEFDVSLDRVGLSQMTKLQEAGSIQTTMSSKGIFDQLKESLGSVNASNVGKNVRVETYASLLEGYNKALDPVNSNDARFAAVIGNLNAHATPLGLRYNPGSYAYSFRFSKGREKRTMEKALLASLAPDELTD